MISYFSRILDPQGCCLKGVAGVFVSILIGGEYCAILLAFRFFVSWIEY